MTKFLILLVGGTIGTTSRYIISGIFYKFLGTDFPHGTLAVNLIGCFIIGFLATITENKFLLGPNARLLLMVGFCGAFTTFSTFMLETSDLIRYGEPFRAFINILLSVCFGFLLFRLGVLLAEII